MENVLLQSAAAMLSGILSGVLAYIISKYFIGTRDKLLKTVPKIRLEKTREYTMEDAIRILNSFNELEGDITQILEKEYGKTKKNESSREKIFQQILKYLLEHDKELDSLIKLAKYKKDHKWEKNTEIAGYSEKGGIVT